MPCAIMNDASLTAMTTHRSTELPLQTKMNRGAVGCQQKRRRKRRLESASQHKTDEADKNKKGHTA